MEKKILGYWEFDDWGHPKKKGKVQLVETEMGLDLEIYSDNNLLVSFCSDIDQWGTWITLLMADDPNSPDLQGSFSRTGFTIAQEDGTLCFLGALIAGLTELKKTTCKCTTGEYVKLADSEFLTVGE